MKYIITLAILLFALIVIACTSCSKEHSVERRIECANCWYVSEKYTQQDKYIRTDTLWHDRICGSWLDSVKLQKHHKYVMCADGSKELTYYIIKH